MSKKFKNIENDEAFKNFKLEDYMPSMPKHEPEESSSVTEQEPVVEAGNLFPVLVVVSGEVRDRLDEIVRRLGGRGMSVSGLIENLARQHMEAYREYIEQWRKL